MSTSRLNVANNSRQVYLKKLSLCLAAFILIAGLSVALGSNLVAAHDTSAESTDTEYKYYKSIELSYGDTLWDIAEEYMNDDYDSIYDYIDELKAINGLESDDIQESQYLTVIYYDKEFH